MRIVRRLKNKALGRLLGRLKIYRWEGVNINEENTFSLFLNSHKLLTKNNLTTKQRVKTILKEDVLELLENYLPVSEVNFILSLPPIII